MSGNFKHRPKPARSAMGALRWWRWLPLGLTPGLLPLVRAENHVEYLFESYVEEDDRMKVLTHGVAFEQQLADAVTARGEFIYDSVSGATPTGTHDADGKVNLTHMEDIRRAMNLALDWRLGSHTVAPGFAYSDESDYTSYNLSLNDTIEFNEKNTSLQLGFSHNFDDVRMLDGKTWKEKQSTEGMVGISQLLSPDDVWNAAFTYGNDSGYLSDPYRLAEYHPVGFPDGFNIGVPERRPSHRNKEVLFTSYLHYFDKLNASGEISYRFYHDSYDIVSHTGEIAWHQWLAHRHLMVEPSFRVTQQSAASFYSTQFSGPFSTNPSGFHSSDYRLSELYTLDAGIKASVFLADHFKVSVGYHRYEMHGMDGKTSAAMYPKANVFSIGASVLW